MARPDPAADLPLRTRTPRAWAVAALADPVALLNDHAHLEKKAAANALGLLPRRPEGRGEAGASGPTGSDGEGGPGGHPERDGSAWDRTLAAVARDEVDHLVAVLRALERRGGRLSATHRNPYAAALHALVRTGDGKRELLDRLLVCALIEARSCERFEALVEACEDEALRALYRGLCASEHGHYRVFVELARSVVDADVVTARFSELLDAEARILAAQPPGPRMHAGSPGGPDA